MSVFCIAGKAGFCVVAVFSVAANAGFSIAGLEFYVAASGVYYCRNGRYYGSVLCCRNGVILLLQPRREHTREMT